MRVSGFGFRVQSFGFQVSGFRFQVSGPEDLRVSGLVVLSESHLVFDFTIAP